MEMGTVMDTKTNLQMVKEGFENFAQGNIRRIIDDCAANVVWGTYKNPDVKPSGNYFGKEGVQEFFAQLAQNIKYSKLEPKEFVAQGDYVIVLGHQSGTVKRTGKTFDHDWCVSIKIVEEKIQRYFAFVDTREQAQAYH